jgi:hypothetical protein
VQHTDERLGGAGADGFVTMGEGGAHGSIVPYPSRRVSNGGWKYLK